MDAGEEQKLTGAADKGPQASDEGALFNNKRCKKAKCTKIPTYGKVGGRRKDAEY